MDNIYPSYQELLNAGYIWCMFGRYGARLEKMKVTFWLRDDIYEPTTWEKPRKKK